MPLQGEVGVAWDDINSASVVCVEFSELNFLPHTHPYSV